MKIKPILLLVCSAFFLCSFTFSMSEFTPGYEPSGKVSVLPLIETEDDALNYIHVRVNDIEGLFLIDTGASLTMLSKEFSEKAGAQRVNIWPFSLSDEHMTNELSCVRIDSISIGHEVFGPCLVAVSDLSRENQTRKQKYDGVIGMSTLKQLVFSIDSKNKEVVLNPAACEGVAVHTRGFDDLSVAVVVAGYTLETKVDTGVSHMEVDRQTFDQIKAVGGNEVTEGSNTLEGTDLNGTFIREFKTLTCRSFNLRELELGEQTVYLTDTSDSLMGAALLLRRFKVTWDVPGQTMYLQEYP